MTTVSIAIKWIGATEVITIDLERLRNGEPVSSTAETWNGHPPHYRYNTDSEFDKDENGGGTLTLIYREEANAHLKGLDCRWGRSKITLDRKMKGGQAEWIDNAESGKPKKIWSGVRPWKRFSKQMSLVGKREIETIKRTARKQAQFRKRLMMIDPRCAITGETEPALLEAAHVVPVLQEGNDIDANGVMLRVDLHRLFDADPKQFKIAKDGFIEVTKHLKSPEYRKLLEDRGTIDKATLERVKGALKRARKIYK